MATNNNRETVYIPLEDVESEHCALIVEKQLAKGVGVEYHKVEINSAGQLESEAAVLQIPQEDHADDQEDAVFWIPKEEVPETAIQVLTEVSFDSRSGAPIPATELNPFLIDQIFAKLHAFKS